MITPSQVKLICNEISMVLPANLLKLKIPDVKHNNTEIIMIDSTSTAIHIYRIASHFTTIIKFSQI